MSTVDSDMFTFLIYSLLMQHAADMIILHLPIHVNAVTQLQSKLSPANLIEGFGVSRRFFCVYQLPQHQLPIVMNTRRSLRG